MSAPKRNLNLVSPLVAIKGKQAIDYYLIDGFGLNGEETLGLFLPLDLGDLGGGRPNSLFPSHFPLGGPIKGCAGDLFFCSVRRRWRGRE